MRAFLAFLTLFVVFSGTGWSQQRPLLSEDPRLVPEGALDVEFGAGVSGAETFAISGLKGTHVSFGQAGLSFGAGSHAEFQLAGTLKDFLRPLDGRWRQDFGDLSVSTKLKILDETSHRPAISFRPSVILPNANQKSGLGLNTTRFFAAVLAGKTAGRAYVFGNVGFGIVDDPLHAGAQQDVMTGGVAALITMSPTLKLAAEVSGVENPRSSPSPGGERHGQVRTGIQATLWGVRWDAGVFAGLARFDAKAGVVLGATRRFIF